MYPGFASQYLRQMRDFRLADYHAISSDAAVHAAAVAMKA
jgi:hypothetical protein